MGFVLAALKIRFKIRLCNSIDAKWAMRQSRKIAILSGKKTFMIRSCVLAVLLISTSGVRAQSVEEGAAIMEPITRLFTGMNLGDSAMVRSAFTPRPTMTTVTKDKSGKPVLQVGDLQKFLKAVGTPHAESWSEPIWDVKVQVDGNLAQVWARYAFYLGKKFSHCGVDAFELFKGEDGKWRIFFLADTRHFDQCEVPNHIKESFK